VDLDIVQKKIKIFSIRETEVMTRKPQIRQFSIKKTIKGYNKKRFDYN